MAFVAEGKPNAPRAATPAEVARTMMARAREAPTVRGPTVSGEREGELDLRERPTEVPDRSSGVRVKGADAETEAPRAGAGTSILPADALAHGRYARVAELGQGGMGRVDEVFDHVLGRTVAKKALLDELDEQRASMLIAEAQICAQLEHPSIVPVYDLDGGPDGKPFYTMRVVRGRTLRDVLADNAEQKEEHTPLAQVLGVFRQVCLAVDYAHSKGVVHRDLKPDNVIVGEFGEVYVVDWGIAHVIQGSSVRLTGHSPTIAGTPAYMAPEQLFGDDIDGRADVFALGVMLYEILAGKRPFADESMLGVRARRRQLVEEPPSQRGSVGEAAGFFDNLVLSCLAPDRKARPGRARVIASAIDEYLDAERERAERQREADEYVQIGQAALAELSELDARASALEREASSLLERVPVWQCADEKLSAWNVRSSARKLRSEAARARARAETQFARAVGRVRSHEAARRGLAALYYRHFLEAEQAGDEEQLEQYLALAREYDTGDLSLELANEGELLIESDAPAHVTLSRYELTGELYREGPRRELGRAPTGPLKLVAGSYVLHVAHACGSFRYPVVVCRALRHRVKLRIPRIGEVPVGMTFIPGGPFSGTRGLRDPCMHQLDLPDFCVGTFPVTFREYTKFLDSLGDQERERRMPAPDKGVPTLDRDGAEWRLGAMVLEGEGRDRVPPERELDLPAFNLPRSNAAAYCEWASRTDGRAYRLPSDTEWEKAMRGVDGRPYPMGREVDPSFAKLRDSRPEAPQPEPVGTFALDESPYGVRDLAGGVGDWTSSFADGLAPPELDAAEGHVAAERQAVWRGATWSSSKAVSPMRASQAIRTWGSWIGFRLALPLDEHGSSELIVEPMAR